MANTPITDKQIEFFLNSRSDVAELNLVQITHPEFTKTYRFVYNVVEGITLPNGDFYQYYSAKITTLTTQDNMDYGIKVSLGDLSEILLSEIKNLQTTDSLDIEPKVDHFVYRHDDLSETMESHELLNLDNFSYDEKSSYFVAKAPALNNTKTDKPYNTEDFSMLESFIR